MVSNGGYRMRLLKVAETIFSSDRMCVCVPLVDLQRDFFYRTGSMETTFLVDTILHL